MATGSEDDASVVLSISATGAVVQMAIGGSASEIVAAGLTPLLESAARAFIGEVGRRRVEKMGQVLAAADVLDPGLGIFDDRHPDYDERLELVGRVLEAAGRSSLPAKIRALTRVLSDGLRQDAGSQEALILARALDVIDGAHVVVLRHLRDQPGDPTDEQSTPDEPLPGWRLGALVNVLPAVATVLDGVLGALDAQGLIRDARGATYASIQGTDVWQITPLGERCLFLLEEPTQ